MPDWLIIKDTNAQVLRAMPVERHKGGGSITQIGMLYFLKLHSLHLLLSRMLSGQPEWYPRHLIKHALL